MDAHNYGHKSSHHHNKKSRDYYGEDRIKKRHEILEKGVPSVWGESPERDQDRSANKIKRRRRSRGRSRSKERSHRSSHKKSKSKHSTSSKKSKRYEDTKRHKKQKREHRKRRRRHSSSSSTSSSLSSSSGPSSKSSSKSSSLKSTHSNSEPQIEAYIVRAERKKPSYVELVNEREKEQFMNELKRKHEQVKQGDPSTSQVGESSNSLDPKEFGKALLPGEGAAMAAYVAGGKRIPRRGEIGLTSNEIERFEQQGYVMSGSRHRRMEAVRLRKESQIYSADEKRALANLDREKSAKKNENIQLYFSRMIAAKQQSNFINTNRDGS